jgi:addiction module HigA family antidote
MKKLANVHPGKILFQEFLKPHKITTYRLAKDLKIPQTRISQIVRGKRRITVDTALRLSKYFGNSAKFWIGVQNDHDIEKEKETKKSELNGIKHFENCAQQLTSAQG